MIAAKRLKFLKIMLHKQREDKAPINKKTVTLTTNAAIVLANFFSKSWPTSSQSHVLDVTASDSLPNYRNDGS